MNLQVSTPRIGATSDPGEPCHPRVRTLRRGSERSGLALDVTARIVEGRSNRGGLRLSTLTAADRRSPPRDRRDLNVAPDKTQERSAGPRCPTRAYAVACAASTAMSASRLSRSPTCMRTTPTGCAPTRKAAPTAVHALAVGGSGYGHRRPRRQASTPTRSRAASRPRSVFGVDPARRDNTPRRVAGSQLTVGSMQKSSGSRLGRVATTNFRAVSGTPRSGSVHRQWGSSAAAGVNMILGKSRARSPGNLRRAPGRSLSFAASSTAHERFGHVATDEAADSG